MVLFRVVIIFILFAWGWLPLFAEDEGVMPPMPETSLEGESDETDEGSDEEWSETTVTDGDTTSTSLTITDWSSLFAQYDWQLWDERITTWFDNCHDAALMTPPLPLGAKIYHHLGIEELFTPFDVLCPHLAAVAFNDIQTWQIRVEEFVDEFGKREFRTLIGNTIVHKLPVLSTFDPIAWIYSIYEAEDWEDWLFQDEIKTREWLSSYERSRIALSLTLVPVGQLSTYNTLMATLAEAERVQREEAQQDPEAFDFTRIDVSETDVFFEFYNPQSVRLNLLTKIHLDEPWTLFGEVDETSSLGYTTFTFLRQIEKDPCFFRIVDVTTDTDGDGLADGLELNYFKSDPTKQDSSGSGINDWDKVYVYQLDPSQRDCDNDGLIDRTELDFGTNPQNADSDNDGLTDAEEVTYLQPAGTFTWIPITTSILEDRSLESIEFTLPTFLEFSGKQYDTVTIRTNGSIVLTTRLSNNTTEELVITGHHSYPYLFIDEESDILFEETTFNNVHCFVFSFVALLFDNERTSQNSITFQIVLSPAHPNRVWLNYLDVGEDKWGGGAIAHIENQAMAQEVQFPRENDTTLMTQISLEGCFGYGTNPLHSDTDLDGLLDGFEIIETETSPLMMDTDGDTLSDGDEYSRYETSPLTNDTDGDTLTDAWEIGYGLNACSAEGANGRWGDPDGDQLINEAEACYYTSPLSADTDEDGLSDLQECGKLSIQTAAFDSLLGTEIGALTSAKNSDLLSATFSLSTPIHTNVGIYSDLFVSLDGYLLLFNSTQQQVSELSSSNTALNALKSNQQALVIAACWSDLYYFANKTTITLSETDTHYFVYYKDVGQYESRREDSIVGSFIISIPKSSNDLVSVYYSNIAPSFSFEKATVGIRTRQLSADIGYKVYQYAYNQVDAITEQMAIHFLIGSSTDPLLQDSDGDGILDGEEIAIKTSPFDSDCDLDGMPDGWELKYSLNPLSAIGSDGADGDNDCDWMRNLEEYRANTSPINGDTDADGLLDSYEYGTITFQSDSTWETFLGMTDVTAQFSSASSGAVAIELDALTFLNKRYTTLSINLNGRIDLFHSDDVPSGLTSSKIQDYNTVDSQSNHIHLAPAASHLYLSSESSILYGTITHNGIDYVVVEYRKMGYYYQRDDLDNHQISIQVIIPTTITPTTPILVHYGEVKGELRGNNVSIGFTAPTHTKGRSLSYYVANKLSSGDSLAIFLGSGTQPTMSDTDCDSLGDLTELYSGSDPLQPDTDNDGLSDGWENQYQYDALTNNDTDDVIGNEKDADSDNDGLTNQEEEILRTNPHMSDSDGDGVCDKEEVEHCSNPAESRDNGLPMSACPVSFTFGDWSTSHSEKYYLSICSLTGMESVPIHWINQHYGEVETKTALLTQGVLYEVELKHASSNQSAPDLDYTLNIKVPNGCGYQLLDVDNNPFGEFDDFKWEECQKKFRFLLLSGNIYCDINRDGVIQADTDGVILRTGKQMLHHWSNDDYDQGNCSDEDGATDVPNGKRSIFNINDLNYRDDVVNGRADLLDFVPLQFDISDLIVNYPITEGYTYALFSDREIGLVFTGLTADKIVNWHTSEVETYDEQNVITAAYQASVYTIKESGLPLNETLLNYLSTGVVMCEGCEPGDGMLKLGILKDDILVTEVAFQFKILEVEDMYRSVDITSIPQSVSKPNEPQGMPDTYFSENAPYVFFLHGFNVTPTTAKGWHAEMFKRLWQTGADMKFVGVTWFGEEGVFEAFRYQENVRNALLSGESLASLMAHYSQDKTVIMAHSLGNMVVASAIQFYGATCDTFMMLNAAIPSEAFGATLSDAEDYSKCSPTEQLFVPEDWYTYPCKSWSTHWHKLFATDEKESKLTWRGLFNNVLEKTTVYNFYSSEDEVFELHASVPAILTGTELDLDLPNVDGIFPYIHLFDTIQVEASRYAWHKQEVFKGANNPVGTKGGGWSFQCRERGFKVYPTGEDAQAATDEELRTRPVFSTRDLPFLSDASQYSRDDYFTLLALHMPALTPAMGRPDLALFLSATQLNQIDMVANKDGWGREHFEYQTRWLHSDIKNMAYFYVHDLFDVFNSFLRKANSNEKE